MKAVATYIREKDQDFFQRTFAHYPDIRLYNARIEPLPDHIDGLMLSGGSDISQGFLRQPVPDPNLIEDAAPDRDAIEFPLLERSLAARIPFFGICRGFQVLNVLRGGTLYLDIPHHDNDRLTNLQPLAYEPDAKLRISHVNSSHHQALDRLGDGIIIEARCATDGVIEQVRLEGHPFALAVQYHPERDELYLPLFDAFIAQVRRA